MTKDLNECPICGYDKFKRFQTNPFSFNEIFRCERCGEFEASHEIIVFSDVKEKNKKNGYILSGLSRELYETGGNMPLFTIENLKETLKHHLIPNVSSIEEKTKKFLQRLREKTEYFGQEIDLGDIETVVPLAYAKNSNELIALFTLMNEKKLTKIGVTDKTVKAKVLENGWEITNSLKKENEKSNRGFIAIWFDESMNESVSAIEEAIQSSGFRSICIKNEQFPETIMEKALGEIRKSRFIVVDLTGERVDVAFEAGFAFGLGIEAIYVFNKEKHKDLPKGFYVRHFKCHGYSNCDELKEIIKNSISARIKN